jgi:hypothetical protein
MTALRRPLTRQEVASLGGLEAAHRLGPEGRKRRAESGGTATVEKYGRAHMKRLALARWGRLPITDTKGNAGHATTGAKAKETPHEVTSGTG